MNVHDSEYDLHICGKFLWVKIVYLLIISTIIKIFTGNNDANTEVTNLFTSPVLATLVRVYPETFDNYVSMRMELLGCEGNWRVSFQKVLNTMAALSKNY